MFDMTDDEFYIMLGSILREERKKKGISQRVLAERMGCTKAAISYWESGDRKMKADVLQRYCDSIGVDLKKVVQRFA